MLSGQETQGASDMDIPADTLAAILGEAFDCGYYGSASMKKQYIEEILAKHRIIDTNDYRLYTAKELSDCPEGTIFHHLSRGRCWVIAKASGKKCMQFEKAGILDFESNEDPWDKPMKMLYAV